MTEKTRDADYIVEYSLKTGGSSERKGSNVQNFVLGKRI